MFARLPRAKLLTMVACVTFAGVARAGEAAYPDWSGAWLRKTEGIFDPNRPKGRGQQPPLTPEFQKVWEKSFADQAAGGQGNNPTSECNPTGMPRMMISYGLGLEFVITPAVAYVIQAVPYMETRRIFTDGRAWPENIDPAFTGTSIGHWEAAATPGHNDTLVVETRGMKGPRSFDSSGIPFHPENSTVVFERIFLDPKSGERLLNDTTVVDKALTRPWSVHRTYHRHRDPQWREVICNEDEHQAKIGEERYYLSADGLLMPTRKGQPPPKLGDFGAAK